MPAYIIAEQGIIHDPDQLKEYGKGVGPTIKQYGGKVIVASTENQHLEGVWNPSRVVVLEFPDVETARKWYDSTDYAKLRKMRMDSVDSNVRIVKGL